MRLVVISRGDLKQGPLFHFAICRTTGNFPWQQSEQTQTLWVAILFRSQGISEI